jgi:methionyl-tRNA synthetase
MSKVLSAVAWPYANGPRHIGHVAGFGVPSDVFSRYQRMAGNDVLMVSGSDEHGTPILIAADEAGVTPQELADTNHRLICEDFVALGLTYDLYTRTTTRNHHAVVQELFLGVHENGYFVEQTTFGAISPSTGRTLPDRYIEGTCPICGYDGARGDQCDNCGNQLDPSDLLNPRSRINGETPEFIETQHFFLDLPALAEALGEWLDQREATGLWRPNVIRFSKNILEEIRPRAMTRDIDWGIAVPLDGWRDNPTKKLYVWFDAVIGYLSASIEWARRIGDAEAWRAWWNDPEALSYYFMGKDNITFHSQIWPAELLAYNGQGAKGGSPRELGTLDLPTEVVSSEFLTMEGRKFSSSKRVVIYVRDLLSRYQPDAFRYFVAAAGPENQDSDFTWAEFVRRTNDELVAGWGNLVNRTANMINKNFGEIPPLGETTPEDEAVLAAAQAAFGVVGDLIGRNRMRQAINEAMRAVAEVNKYVSDAEPWKIARPDSGADPARLGTVLHVAAQCVADLNLVLAPFLPFAANEVDRALGGKGEVAPMPRIEEAEDLDGGAPYPIITGDYTAVPEWRRHPLVVGAPVAKPTPIFTKLDPAIVDEELARLGA